MNFTKHPMYFIYFLASLRCGMRTETKNLKICEIMNNYVRWSCFLQLQCIWYFFFFSVAFCFVASVQLKNMTSVPNDLKWKHPIHHRRLRNKFIQMNARCVSSYRHAIHIRICVRKPKNLETFIKSHKSRHIPCQMINWHRSAVCVESKNAEHKQQQQRRRTEWNEWRTRKMMIIIIAYIVAIPFGRHIFVCHTLRDTRTLHTRKKMKTNKYFKRANGTEFHTIHWIHSDPLNSFVILIAYARSWAKYFGWYVPLSPCGWNGIRDN